MSRRMSFSISLWLWSVGVLFFVASLKADPPQTDATNRNVVEQFADEFEAPAAGKPGEPARVEIAQNLEKPVQPSPSKAQDRPLGEESDVEKTVLFQVRVYEVDHSGWAKEQGVEKRKQALDELLRPWIGTSRGSKLDRENVKAWTTKVAVPASDVEKLGEAVRLVAEPKLAVIEGQSGSFDYGGKTPKLRLIEVHGNSTTEGNKQLRPLATTFTLESGVTDAGRVLVSVHFNPEGHLLKKRSTNDELKKHGIKAAAELSVGQTMCLSDARTESSDNDDSLLVTITPYEIVTREVEKRIPPVAVAPAKPAELEITVEDRWPIADIKVGQRVIAIPVTIEKTSLQADLSALVFSFDSKYSQRVTRIEPLPNQAGRRVTVSVPFTQHPGVDERLKAVVENYLEGARSASSTFVIPTAMVSQTDVMSGRPVQELYTQIPAELRPRPVELTVGETFTAYGVSVLMGSAKAEAHHEIGALSFDYLNDDAGGIWRATATKIGTTRLIQLAVGSDLIGPARLTEYLVKADTRELEHHIRQQFPSAKATITSIGANAVMLNGSVASDEESHGIVELAQQFAPKVLNRLKIPGSAIGSRTRESSDRSLTTSATEPRAVRQANGIADDADSKSSGELPRVMPASATSPKRTDQLRELRDEIRKLRREVRSLSERLEREASPPATSQMFEDAPASEFDKLVSEFNALMSQQRFSKAEDAAMRANELSPGNETVRVMLLRSRFAQQNWQDNPVAHFEKLVKQFDQLMNDKRFAEAEVVAKQAKEVSLGEPAELMLIKAQHARFLLAQEQSEPKQGTHTRTAQPPMMPLAAERATLGLTEQEARIARQLNTVVDLDANDLPLSKVIEQLARKANINIVLDQSGLLDEGLKTTTPVTLQVRDVRFSTALRLLLEPLSLESVVKNEVLLITSRQRASGQLTVATYPIPNLTWRKDAKGNDDVDSDLSELCDLLMTMIEPTSWEIAGGPATVRGNVTTQSLVVRQTQANHARIRDLLETLW